MSHSAEVHGRNAGERSRQLGLQPHAPGVRGGYDRRVVDRPGVQKTAGDTTRHLPPVVTAGHDRRWFQFPDLLRFIGFLGVSKFLILKPGFYRVSTKQIRDGNQSAPRRIQCPLQLRLSCVLDELSARSGTLAIIYLLELRNNSKR